MIFNFKIEFGQDDTQDKLQESFDIGSKLYECVYGYTRFGLYKLEREFLELKLINKKPMGKVKDED